MKIKRSFFSGFWAKLLVSGLYVGSFFYAYIHFLNFYFSYVGYDIILQRKDNIFLITTTVILGILPTFFFRGIKEISSFLCIFLYFILFVPIIITYHFSIQGGDDYVIYQQLLFVFGMCLLFLADRIKVRSVYVIKTNTNLFRGILLFTVLITTLMIAVYGSSLRIVSFADVYDLRSENKDLGHGIIMSYLSAWLVNVMIPICLSYSLFSKKRLYFLAGVFGCVIVYMATGAKTAVVFPFVTYFAFKLFTKFSFRYSFFTLGLVLSVIIIIITLSEFSTIGSLIMMRTLGNGGDLTRHYHDFFINHPYTYYSHINIVNLFTNAYPYKDPLGVVIGNNYWGDTNANANFWATDGYAAAGDFGVIITSIFLFSLFILFNGISKRYNKVFMVIVLIPYLTSFLNTSMFQSLLTGGAILIFLFLSFSSVRTNKYIT